MRINAQICAVVFVPLLLFLSTTVAIAQSDIHRVDFKNFTYFPMCVGSKPRRVTVTKGEYSKATQMSGYVDNFYFVVSDVTFGDLNAGGGDEAVILTNCNTGGTGNFSEGFVYTMRAGKPVLVTRIPGGDRAYGGLRSARIANGILSVDSNDAGELGGACCPEYAVTTTYRLRTVKLLKFGTPVRRELYPKHRLTFALGASAMTFREKLEAQDLKRYVVSAKAGQVLSVSAGTPGLSIRLLDDAKVTEGENGFSAHLPKNGDYAFEIQNIDTKPIEVTITVRIK
ncbi:MAG: hypothetical protein ACR2IH_00875 [Pyrinomonadaceae bacterium]